MPGSPDTRPAPDLPPGRRIALVVSTTTYADSSLRQLRAPARDAEDLRDLLADPDIGGFAVTSVTDGTAQDVRLAVEEFLTERSPDDLLLVYLSCHGLVDLRRRLYFAASDTLKSRLAATGVEAQWLLDQLEDCRARQQVLILDCCFSGAFAHGAKGDADLRLGERFHGQGRGRVVLTASRASEYSFEGEPVAGSAMPGSVFTSALVAGIRNGAADADNDGYISVDDAYAYAFDHVRATDAEQTPQRWLYGAEGTILLARSPAGVTITPAALPTTLRVGLDSPHPEIRLGAVAALGDWLTDDDPSRELAARQTLQQIVETDVPRVAAAADALLGSGPPGDRSTPQPGSFVPLGQSTQNQRDKEAPLVRFLRSERQRRWIVYASIVAVLVGGGVTAALLIPGRDGSPPGSGDAENAPFTMESPWRLVIRDEIQGQDDGCTVTVTNTNNGEPWRETIYGRKSFQMQQTGTFRWEANDPGCLVIQRSGSGTAELPFAWEAATGDTDAFEATNDISIEVTDFGGYSECDFRLHDATDGQLVNFGTVTDGGENPLILSSEGRTHVYLADLECGVRVSAGET